MWGSDHMNGWDWLFGSVMMLFWIAVLGAVVFIAVNLARGDWPRGHRP